MRIRRRFAGIALTLAMLFGAVGLAAPADAAVWWGWRCYHGNVGPSGDGNFWRFMGEVGSGHRYDHYVRSWSGYYYLDHTDYTTGCH